MKPNSRPLEEIAVFVHGALAFGHLLGVLHNVRRKNAFEASFHAAAAAFDGFAVVLHIRSLREESHADHEG